MSGGAERTVTLLCADCGRAIAHESFGLCAECEEKIQRADTAWTVKQEQQNDEPQPKTNGEHNENRKPVAIYP